MQLLDLPRELIDLVFDHLFACSEHAAASRTDPCIAWHPPTLTHVRLVCKLFSQAMTPPLFDQIVLKRATARHVALPLLARSVHLTPHVHTLRLDLSPRDFGRAWAADIHGYPARDRVRYYLEDLGAWLQPALRTFVELRVLNVRTTYDGIELAGMSRGELLMPCFEALCNIIRSAHLQQLEEVQVGLPYEGGYAGFFQDTGHKLTGVSEALLSASVKLEDWQNNFTVMPIRL